MANTPKKSVSKPAAKKPTTATEQGPTKRQRQVRPSTISVKTTKSSSATPIYDSVVKQHGYDPLQKKVSKPATKAPAKKRS
jgi:hypothetical protein